MFCGIFANFGTVVGTMCGLCLVRTIVCEHFSSRTFTEHVEHLLSSVVVRILCSLCSILHLFLETVRTWSLFRQKRTGNGMQNSNGACGLLLLADGAGFLSVKFLRATLHKVDFDPKLQKNWVTGETWELQAPASLRHCDPSRRGEGSTRGANDETQLCHS